MESPVWKTIIYEYEKNPAAPEWKVVVVHTKNKRVEKREYVASWRRWFFQDKKDAFAHARALHAVFLSGKLSSFELKARRAVVGRVFKPRNPSPKE